MLDNFNLGNLPSVKLSEKDRLPTTAGIYFALNSSDRLWYIGKARNLNQRWINHHRYHQLEKINRKTPITLKWHECENDEHILTQLENYFTKSLTTFSNWYNSAPTIALGSLPTNF
jgi:excinuclease UvrABC nuclease subunit